METQASYFHMASTRYPFLSLTSPLPWRHVVFPAAMPLLFLAATPSLPTLTYDRR